MKRLTIVLALAGFAVTPAAAQWVGMPMWNSPKGGTGVTVSGDLAMPNENAGKGTAFGARGTLGLANLSVTAGLASWKPDGAADSYTSIGGNAAFRVMGGSLLPVAINLQVGGATVGEANGQPSLLRVTAGGGIAASVPTPGISIEPYLSLTNRWYKYSGIDIESNFGWTIGANANFGMLGVHLAYDSESAPGGSRGILAIGAHIQLKAPVGM
jgi:hypothetical protein